jgi:NAD kinase
MIMKYQKIGIISSNNKQAILRKSQLVKKYNLVDLSLNLNQQLLQMDLIIALGGDGLMLHLLHLIEKKTIY